MQKVAINRLVPNTEYYIQYEGADQDDYIINEKYTKVRKLGTFKRLIDVPSIGITAYFINIRDVNTGKLSNEMPFPKGEMSLPSHPYYFYKVPSQVIFKKIMDTRTNPDIVNYSKGYIGGNKSRKNKKSKKSRKSRKNKKLKK